MTAQPRLLAQLPAIRIGLWRIHGLAIFNL